MKRPKPRRSPRPIAVRWAERQLFFWTARQTLRLIVLAALTVYLVVSLLKGELPGLEHLLSLASAIPARMG